MRTRAFRGRGFEIDVPAGWEDRSIYTLRPSHTSQLVSGLWIVPDSDPGVKTSEQYFWLRDRARLEGAPSRRALNRQRVRLGHDLEGWMGEYAFSLPDGTARFERMFCVLFPDAGFTLSTDFSSKGRKVFGPTVSRIMSSLKPIAASTSRVQQTKATTVLTYDGFRLVSEGEWRDDTTYVVAEPGDGGFRENVVVRLDAADESATNLEQLAGIAEAELAPPDLGAVILQTGACRAKDGRPAWTIACRRPAAEGRSMLQIGFFAQRGEFRINAVVTLADRGAESVVPIWLDALKKFRMEED